jgi:hypothetical protein
MQSVPITTKVVSLNPVMVFNVIFNNISVISWQFVFLVEETGVPEENHRPAASHLQTLFHNVVLSTPHLNRIQTHNFSGGLKWVYKGQEIT